MNPYFIWQSPDGLSKIISPTGGTTTFPQEKLINPASMSSTTSIYGKTFLILSRVITTSDWSMIILNKYKKLYYVIIRVILIIYLVCYNVLTK